MKHILLICVLLLSLVLTTTAQQDDVIIDYGFTYQNATGNRYIEGQGDILDSRLSITTYNGDAVNWLVPIAVDDTFVFHNEDGNRDFFIDTLLMGSDAGEHFPDQQTLVGIPALWNPFLPLLDVSPLSHPVPVDNDVVYIADNGDLVLWRDELEIHRLPINAMLDARPMVSDAGLIAIYTNPTDRYPHGVFGDELEGGALDILQVDGDVLRRVAFVQLDEDVFEGLYPFWADIDQDGEQDIVTTVSGRGLGAGLRVYRADGSILAQGERIGLSNRWRHQLAFAPFGVDGEYELVEIITPHIGGVVNFVRYNPETAMLETTARVSGYTSHVYGSRNVDMAIAGDYNDDGQPELVVTTQDGSRLVGLQRGLDDIITEVWSINLSAQIITNFAGIRLPDDRIGLLIGFDDDTIYRW